MADQWQAALDALQAQVTNLQNTVNQQNAQIVAGNAQNAALQAQQAQWLLPAANISRKVETLADPGRYSGERVKFLEWWTKMKVWIRVNDAILPLAFDKAAAVWSHMEGPIAGRYAANRLNECTRINFWPDFDDLCTEVEGFFSPQTSTEWAKQELRKLKQGGSRIDDFMAKFVSLKVQGKVSDDFGCALLEQAVKPELLREVLLTNTDISIWEDFVDQTMKVGRNLERLHILRGGGYGYQRSYGGGARFSAAGTQPGAGAPMDIGAARQGQPQQRAGNPQCYNCQQFGHIARNCRNRKVPRGQAPQPAAARVAEIPAQPMAGPSNADERVRALQGMDFDTMRAYFLNLKD